MALSPAPIQNNIASESGKPDRIWSVWFSAVFDLVTGGVPFRVKSVSVASLPDAASFEGCIVYVTDEAGGKTIAFSDGTNWRRTQDRNIVS